MVPFVRIPGPLFEYACHAGDYSLSNILAGQRAKEREHGGEGSVGRR